MTAAEMAYKTSAAECASAEHLVMQELSQVYYIARGSVSGFPSTWSWKTL